MPKHRYQQILLERFYVMLPLYIKHLNSFKTMILKYWPNTTQFIAECPSGTSTSDFKPFKYKNKCFMVSIDAMPWNAARQVCKRLDNNYDLAVIDNEDENTALENFAISSGKEFWIGFHDISTEGKFTWVNGSDNAFGTVHGIKPWHSGEPNNVSIYIQDNLT